MRNFDTNQPNHVRSKETNAKKHIFNILIDEHEPISRIIDISLCKTRSNPDFITLIKSYTITFGNIRIDRYITNKCRNNYMIRLFEEEFLFCANTNCCVEINFYDEYDMSDTALCYFKVLGNMRTILNDLHNDRLYFDYQCEHIIENEIETNCEQNILFEIPYFRSGIDPVESSGFHIQIIPSDNDTQLVNMRHCVNGVLLNEIPFPSNIINYVKKYENLGYNLKYIKYLDNFARCRNEIKINTKSDTTEKTIVQIVIRYKKRIHIRRTGTKIKYIKEYE